MDAELREYAETPDRFSRVGAGVHRFADERVCVLEGSTWVSVSGVRADGAEVASLLEEVRGRTSPEKSCVWWIGPSTRPQDLHRRLSDLGLREPRDRVSVLRALVLVEEPEPPPDDVPVRRVETLDEYRALVKVQWEAFETPAHRREAVAAHLERDYEAAKRSGVPVAFLAYADGRPAATGLAIPSARGVFLIGGATAPWGRGRGLYRALVRARWDYAAQRGTPALVTHADPRTSYPILRRLGFEEVCELRRLEDVRA